MRKRKNSKVIHGDIFIITCICVLVIWFDPTVECHVGALRWMRSDMAFQFEYLEIRVKIGCSNSVRGGVYSFEKYCCYYFFYIKTGLKLRVRNENLFFLPLNQNICCGYSKEPSQ